MTHHRSEKFTVHSNRRLPGKMHRWQRLWTFWLFSICFASGIIWFVSLDLFQVPVPKLRLWWVLHGCTSLATLVLIGAALPQHLVVTWKAGRNIRHGILVVAGLLALLLTALGLFYGPEEWHEVAHWLHSTLGLLVAVIFPLHVWRGRAQKSKSLVANHASLPANPAVAVYEPSRVDVAMGKRAGG